MKKLSELFALCDYEIEYQEIGDDVNYAFLEEGEHLYIFFEGSASIADWWRNFWFFPKSKKPYKNMDIPFKVHRGFLAAWKEVEDVIMNKIVEKAPGGDSLKWKHITIVGYSHGGALAAFCHEMVYFYRPDLRQDGFEGYGFEAPRILSCFRVPKRLKPRWEKFTVIRTNYDLVTHCPPWFFRFCHVGRMLKIKGDRSLVKEDIPNIIKDHFPQVVLQALINAENKEIK